MIQEINVIKNEVEGDCPNYVLEAIDKVEKFFNAKLDFKIVFLETREEMDEVYSKMFDSPQKTEDWVVGGYFGEDSVYMFSEEVYSNVSIHKQETFLPTLVHEITHIFSNKVLKFHLPMWLDEGLSYVIADQDKVNLDVKEDIIKAYSEEEWMKTNPYKTSGKFVRFLIDSYGKDKLLLLLNELEFYEEKENFEKKFLNIFGKDFKQMFNEWNPLD
jgi:hypothetical protein